MNRILVIQTASLGDVVLATALLEKLHACYPEAELDILVQKGADGLFKGHPFLRKVWTWDKHRHKYAGMFSLIRQIRKQHYDTVVNVQRFAATGWISIRSGAGRIVGFRQNPFSWGFTDKIPHEISSETYLYEVDRNQRLIAPFTDTKSAATRLYPTETDFEAIQKYRDKKYVTLSPSSLWQTKQYPKERWIELIQRLPKSLNIYLNGGKNDSELCEEIRNACPKQHVVNLSGKLSLLQSAALMQDAERNFTNDSAPLHLAVAVGAPVTAVFCSTVREFGFAPSGENIRIIETKESLPCRPCGLHGHPRCPQKHFRCAWGIPAEQLLKTLNHELE